jgi:uncharacterized protein
MRLLAPIVLALACGAALPAAAAATKPPPLPQYKEFKDWLLACDNGGRCEAKGFAESDGTSVLRIARDPGPDGRVEISLEAGDRFGVADLRLDDTAVPKGWWADKSKDGDYLLTVDGQQNTTDVLQALLTGTTLTLGGDAGEVSLNGITAALLGMDDAQGRVGTRTALIHPGTVAASTVPAGPALPVLKPPAPAPAPLSDSTAKTLIAGVRSSQEAALSDCTVAPDEPRYDQAVALTDTEALVMVDCIHGAYQTNFVVFRAPVKDAKAAQRLVLPNPTGDAFDEFMGSDYEAASGEFTFSAKGRGPADCGESASWIFDGKDFQLNSFNRQDKCSGLPGDWPTLWRVAETKTTAATTTPAATTGQAKPSFDCTKAKSDVEKAICADPALSRADAEIAQRYRALRAALDPAAATALQADQGYFVSNRNDGFKDFKDLQARLDERLDFLGKVKTEVPAGFAGTWGNLWGEVEIKPAGGRVSVAIQTVEQTTGRWVCNADGSAAPKGATLTIPGDSGWFVKLTREGSVLKVEGIKPAGGDAMQPFCGLNGSVDGTFFPLTGAAN